MPQPPAQQGKRLQLAVRTAVAAARLLRRTALASPANADDAGMRRKVRDSRWTGRPRLQCLWRRAAAVALALARRSPRTVG
jgi:hypothetical protein